jgi:hypothetical protein
MKKTLSYLASASALSLGLGIASMAPASAFSISGGSVNNITASDVGSSFDVLFDGKGGSQARTIAGLTSTARFTLTAFNTSNQTASFNVLITNNSSGSVTQSRVSVLGFDTNPNVNLNQSTVSGIFNTIESGNVPIAGAVEVCFTGVNCAGGGSGGVFKGNSGSFTTTLKFNSPLSNLSLSNFTVRYQNIAGVQGITSGAGDGTPVPEPITLLGSGIALGFGMYAKRKLNGQKAKI